MAQDTAAWVSRQRELLKVERQAESEELESSLKELTAQECQEKGYSLLRLAVAEVGTGLFGRTSIVLADGKGLPLPSNKLSSGDEVRVYSQKEPGNSASLTGVVSSVTEKQIIVLTQEEGAEELRPPLRLDLLCSEATFAKLNKGLDALERYGEGPSARLRDVLFGREPPLHPVDDAAAAAATEPLAPLSEPLNDSQLAAIRFALASRDIALIHGPPGTGKTTTVVELIRQALGRGLRCLVCAPSNVAVDNVLLKLVAPPAGGGSGNGGSGSRGNSGSGHSCSGGGGGSGGDGYKASSGGSNVKPRVARLGHPARLLEPVLRHSLEALVAEHDGTALVSDARKELKILYDGMRRSGGGGGSDSGRRSIGSNRRARGIGGGGGGGGCGGGGGAGAATARRQARFEVRALQKEIRGREEAVVADVIKSRNVVLATCVGAASRVLRGQVFDLVIIDEAAQALEAACWIPILMGRRLVLAGDHKQLPPTVKSGNGSSGKGPGLSYTLFDRLLQAHGEGISRLLCEQYRMHQDICNWASREMYGGKLQAHPSVAMRTLAALPGVRSLSEDSPAAAAAMLLVDTTGCDMAEERVGSGSYRNEGEARVAAAHVAALVAAGVPQADVAIVTPYNGQVELLRGMLRSRMPFVEVRSVDGFQGGEREAIVISLVRSSADDAAAHGGDTEAVGSGSGGGSGGGNGGGSSARLRARGGIGFLSDDRRLNVAVTRAKRHVAIICDAEHCSRHPFLKRLLDHVAEVGEHRSALEFAGNSEIVTGEAPAAAAVQQLAAAAAMPGAAAAATATAAAKGGEAEAAAAAEPTRAQTSAAGGPAALPASAAVAAGAAAAATAAADAPAGATDAAALPVPPVAAVASAVPPPATEAAPPPPAAVGTKSETSQSPQPTEAQGNGKPSAEYASATRAQAGKNPSGAGAANGSAKASVGAVRGPISWQDEDVVALVQDFAARGKPGQTLTMPLGLSARQRAAAHEVAEAIGLEHYSEGDGSRRRLVLRAKKPPDSNLAGSGGIGGGSVGSSNVAGSGTGSSGGGAGDDLGFGTGGNHGGTAKSSGRKLGKGTQQPVKSAASSGGSSRAAATNGAKKKQAAEVKLKTAVAAKKAAAPEAKAAPAPASAGAADDEIDEDLAFLDAEIAAKKAAAPAYQRVLSMTNAVQTARNPTWRPEPRPAASKINEKARGKLAAKLEQKLAEEEKRRGRKDPKAEGKK